MKNVDTLSVIATAFFSVTLSTKDLVWKSIQNLYEEGKTIETTQQTFNSFGKRRRKWQQDKAVGEENTNFHIKFYWTT